MVRDFMSETAPNASRFAPLPPERAAMWSGFPNFDRVLFPRVLASTASLVYKVSSATLPQREPASDNG